MLSEGVVGGGGGLRIGSRIMVSEAFLTGGRTLAVICSLVALRTSRRISWNAITFDCERSYCRSWDKGGKHGAMLPGESEPSHQFGLVTPGSRYVILIVSPPLPP